MRSVHSLRYVCHLAIVAIETGVDPEAIMCGDPSVRQKGSIRSARRQVYARLWRDGLSLQEIGFLTNRDRSAVRASLVRELGDEYDRGALKRRGWA